MKHDPVDIPKEPEDNRQIVNQRKWKPFYSPYIK